MPKKLLLDEALPRPLAASFSSAFKVHTVQEMGWTGSHNGHLLKLAAKHGFDALLTVDQGFEHEQNPDTLPVPVIILIVVRNRLQDLQPLVPEVVTVLRQKLQRRIYRIPA